MITAPKDVKAINPNAKDDGIQLPFTAPIIYWRNGKQELAQLGGVSYFGGWDGNDDDIEAAVTEFDKSVPQGFAAEARHGKGGEYAVYSSRSIAIAPIKMRERWKDGRSHSQTLCLLGMKSDDGGMDAWGTVVLSTKGWATKHLSDAIKAWATHSKKARVDWASNIPSWYFWQYVGTFGEFKSELVGASVKSPITQIETYLPDIGMAKNLELLYVGEDNYRLMSELSEQAEEWANDKRWSKGEEQLIETQTQNASQGNNYGVSEDLSVDEAFPPESNPFA